MRAAILLLCLPLAAGCSSLTKGNVEGPSQADRLATLATEIPLYLDSAEVRTAALEDFMKDRTAFSEIDKINYLLSAISRSQAVFIRNGQHFGGSNASGWLRWKMRHPQYKNDPIVTARDFVDRVAIRSERTGFPYEVIPSGGERRALRDVLSHELSALEDSIRQSSLMNALSEEGKSLEGAQQKIPAPIMIPTASR